MIESGPGPTWRRRSGWSWDWRASGLSDQRGTHRRGHCCPGRLDAFKRSVLAAERATRSQMLAEASVLLASYLNYETTLESLTQSRPTSSPTGEPLIWSTTTGPSVTAHRSRHPVDAEMALQFQRTASVSRTPYRSSDALRLRSSVLLSDMLNRDSPVCDPAQNHAVHRRTGIKSRSAFPDRAGKRLGR